MHSRPPYRGTETDLAIVKKMMERPEGRIFWEEGSGNKVSCFRLEFF
ncbi:hypothetical protein [Flavilitoribacter nigricans]|nr:hypothetical protein [Flavilitoribacter nigricans]